MERLAVIGLGKLGLCTAACFASKGFAVAGYDSSRELIAALREGRNPIQETGLDELLEKVAGNFQVFESIEKTVEHASIFFIIVPTPSGIDGAFDNRCVVTALREIAPLIRGRADFPIVNIVSTVMPGSADKIFKPLLEEMSGGECGKNFGLLYNPEFIALGTVIHNFLHPDMVLIGASDAESSRRCAAVYEQLTETRPEIHRMSLLNAEITKLALNCCVTAKISYVNALAELCECLPGADIDAVTGALGADSRIGKKYLRAGTGFGGPCFPRDNEALLAFAGQTGLGENSFFSDRVVAVNNRIKARLHNLVRSLLRPGATIAVLGLAYKPGTHIVERSQGFELAVELAKQGYRVRGWDPQATDNAARTTAALSEKLELRFSANLYECVAGAAGILVCLPCQELHQADWQRIAVLAPQAALLDAWRELRYLCPPGFTYRALGLGAQACDAAEK